VLCEWEMGPGRNDANTRLLGSSRIIYW